MLSKIAIQVTTIAGLLILASCTTVENDRSTNYVPQVHDTAIMVTPLNREERNKLLEASDLRFKTASAPFRIEKDDLMHKRDVFTTALKEEFPDCAQTKHCLSTQMQGDIKKFERYRYLTSELLKLDLPIAELENKIHSLEQRNMLESRYILNRFLVGELLKLGYYHGTFRAVRLQSIEAFPSRKALGDKLISLSDVPYGTRYVEDYDFRQFGLPIDEGALVVSLEIEVAAKDQFKLVPQHYYESFLVNVQQYELALFDNLPYSRWLNLFAELDQVTLKKRSFCGLYALGTPSFISRLQVSKSEYCIDERNRQQYRPVNKHFDHFFVENWVVPLAYYKSPLQKENWYYIR